MIRKLFKHFGYIHESEITEDYLCYELAKLIGDPEDYEIDDKFETTLFKDLSNVEGFQIYLRSTAARDMQRHFGTAPDQQGLVHGAFGRTLYLANRIKKASNKSLNLR